MLTEVVSIGGLGGGGGGVWRPCLGTGILYFGLDDVGGGGGVVLMSNMDDGTRLGCGRGNWEFQCPYQWQLLQRTVLMLWSRYVCRFRQSVVQWPYHLQKLQYGLEDFFDCGG